jgi:hypothetical protein
MDERAFGVLAFRVSGVRKPFGHDVVAEGNAM